MSSASSSEPVVRWTAEEAWLMAELARRALVATLDGGRPVRPALDDGAAAFRAEIQASAETLAISVHIDARAATLALAPEIVAGHRWRDGWLLEVTRGTEQWTLERNAPAIAIADARREPLRVELRIRRRMVAKQLDGGDEIVPLVDAAFHRYTRQSTAATPERDLATVAPWMTRTLPESAPWWEIDLGRTLWIAYIRIDLAMPPPDTRVVCRVYGFLTMKGTPPANSIVFDAPAETLARDGDRAWFAVEHSSIARYIRVELVAPASQVALEVTATEVFAAELYVETLAASIRRAFLLHGHRVLCLDAQLQPQLTYREAWLRAMALARGLAGRIETPGERTVLGVMTRNRAEWILVELAALARGYVVIAMSPDDSDERVQQIVARAKPVCIVCEADDAARLGALGLQLVVLDDGFARLVADGERAEVSPPAPRSEDDLYTVLFTSGSTGIPKGAMRTYRTFHKMIASYAIAHSPRHLSFQPLSHLSERMYLPALFVHGGTIAFSRGGAHLLDELRALGPTTVGTVPRLFEVLHASYQRRVRAAVAAEPAASPEIIAQIETRALAEARASFGTNLLAVSVGSAPVSAEVLAFMRKCFADVWVSEGYGSTEVGSITFDGRVLEHVEVKLVPRRDAPPRRDGDPERGEIYVRTPHTIAGYLGDPDATKAALDDDGFFATGDLGERDADGRVRVVGRIRNTVKLAQGEFVSAERIEMALAAAPIVDRIFVHVEHGAPGVAALVVPQRDALAALDARDPEAAVLSALRTHGLAHGLASYEIPRAVLLEHDPPTIENGLVTPNGKLARGALTARYGARLSILAAGTSEVDLPVGDDLTSRIVAVVSRIVGRAIDAHEPLVGVGIDSLAAAEILEALSDELARDVPLTWWFEATSLADLAGRLAGGGDGGGELADLADEDLALPPIEVAARVPPAKIARILLTGATGFLGAHLAAAFAARGIAVKCLVRAPDDAAARDRLARALADRELTGTADAIAGDLAALAGRDELFDGIDAIVHAGATVSWLAPYSALRAPNVHGTHALLALAAARGIPMHYVSTISTAPVGGDERARLTREAALASTPYGLSKWIAEDHVRRAGLAGLPVAIYRPAMIAASTITGIGNRDDFVNRYMTGCTELGLYIDRDDGTLDMTPVDFVASAIAALVLARPLGGGTFHFANVDQSLTFAALGRAMVAAGARLAPASYPEFRAALLANKASRLHALAAFFPEPFTLGMGPWPCAATLAALTDLGIRRPRIDDAIVARYFTRL